LPLFYLDHYCPQVNELVIDCVIRGKPMPTVKWFRNMVPLGVLPDERMTVYHHHDENLETITTSVTIYAPNYGDSGRYDCVIENEIGTNRLVHKVIYGTEEEFFKILNNREKEKGQVKEKELRLKKKQEEAKIAAEEAEKKAKAEADAAAAAAALAAAKKLPKTDLQLIHDAVETKNRFDFVSVARNRSVILGKSTRLSCVVKSLDQVESEWYKNGQRLANGIRLSNTTTREGACYLEIERCRLTDTGTYKCVATSKKFGEISCECELEVYQLKCGDLEPTFTRILKRK
jgi:hypothetical protein